MDGRRRRGGKEEAEGLHDRRPQKMQEFRDRVDADSRAKKNAKNQCLARRSIAYAAGRLKLFVSDICYVRVRVRIGRRVFALMRCVGAYSSVFVTTDITIYVHKIRPSIRMISKPDHPGTNTRQMLGDIALGCPFQASQVGCPPAAEYDDSCLVWRAHRHPDVGDGEDLSEMPETPTKSRRARKVTCACAYTPEL
ncbi:hypothetical protein LZ30DRAFT_805621 [Colletotrichum cereale]|nr:hypothetical protein LZ30DRAFT_805621 [Colletotrichum cereale]